MEDLKYNAQGLMPVIIQDSNSGEVLMLAYMDKVAVERTLKEKYTVFYSRSRNKYWVKGEESGHVQKIHEIRLDCDEDVVLLKIEQVGGIACHTGRHSCFFKKLENENWLVDQPVIKDPQEIYKHE